jgi:hypothetical protein
MNPPTAIAYFITHHGYGHATRAAAVMAAVERVVAPQVRFELFTTCPRAIFNDSLKNNFGYHAVQADVGMVQDSPLKADIEATCRKLADWIPFDTDLIGQLAEIVLERRCARVVCDISPLGIAVAQAARLPCVLIENFTWDWIYAPYTERVPALAPYVDYLSALYAQADLRIQTEPLCQAVDGALVLPPISRMPRTAPDVIREGLNIAADQKMVLVSMGGVPDRFEFLGHLPADLDAVVVITGIDSPTVSHPSVITLPAHSAYYHPDLLQAADLLIGKAGYSTIAEAYQCGTPFGFVARADSPESPPLERFILKNMSSRPIRAEDYHCGRWLRMLPELLTLPRSRPATANGAIAAADVLCRQ